MNLFHFDIDLGAMNIATSFFKMYEQLLDTQTVRDEKSIRNVEKDNHIILIPKITSLYFFENEYLNHV